MYYARTIEKTVLNVSKTFPALLLSGPRQVGKTTLLEKLAASEDAAGGKRTIVSLDNPTVRALAKTDPELFLQRYAPPVLIDEVQYAPELFPYIKIAVDKRKKPGDFWLTGSQMFRMMKNVTETLAGRVGIIPLLGLSNSELNDFHPGPFTADILELTDRINKCHRMSVTEIFERLYKGSMPRLYEVDDVNRNLYFESYLDTYIARDVHELEHVGDETAYLNFIRIVAARTATNVNYDALAQEAGISAPTAKKWLSVLVSSGIVLLIQPYFNNALKRVIKTPRMYFSDTGLCAHMMGWGAADVLENSAMSGAFFETWVVGEIYKSYLNVGLRPPLYFYRDSNKKEIDLIICQNGMLYPIEIKKSAAPKDATRNFSVLSSIERAETRKDASISLCPPKTTIGCGMVVCLASDLIPADRKNWLVPAWII